jgi:hypothetical protein
MTELIHTKNIYRTCGASQTQTQMHSLTLAEEQALEKEDRPTGEDSVWGAACLSLLKGLGVSPSQHHIALGQQHTAVG